MKPAGGRGKRAPFPIGQLGQGPDSLARETRIRPQ
jgi:hypothetical protein